MCPKKDAKDKGKDKKGKGKKGEKKPKKKEDFSKMKLPGTEKGKSSKKKKWSKAKNKERLNNSTFFDKDKYERLINDIGRQKIVTISSISDKLKVAGNCARQGIKELLRLKKIKLVGDYHGSYSVYSKA